MNAIPRAALILPLVVAAHIPLLRLPFFWDEAGYYIPAARDLLLRGTFVPETTLHTAHTPLLSILLATVWKLFGYGIPITRITMLAVAAFGLWQVYGLAQAIADRSVAVASLALTGLYPVVFAQSSMAHSDLLATALVWWGLRAYFDPSVRRWQFPLAFTLAVLAKEIVIVVPLALAGFELLRSRATDWRRVLTLIGLPMAVLLGWFGFQRIATGAWFGDPEYYRYNVSATITPLRIFFAFAQRLWHAFGHMNMWVLSLLTAGPMLLPAKTGRERIAIPVQLAFATVIFVTLLFHSVLGGALLTRYLLPIFPLVIVIGVSTLWRRVPQWQWVAAGIGVTFAVACVVNPPYRFAPEDNLNYAAFIRVHQQAAQQIESHYARGVTLTAWPASDELTRPELGYVARPARVLVIKDFTQEQVLAARERDFQAMLLFSTKYEPPRAPFESKWWLGVSLRFFDYHHDVNADEAARLVGGRVTWRLSVQGQSAAIIERDREAIQNARAPLIDP